MGRKYKLNIVVVGSGGTGGAFLKELARFVGKGYQNILSSICVVDGDVVEEKNLTRQCFLTCDIGRNKASVMADQLSDVFHMSLTAYSKYILTKEELSTIFRKAKNPSQEEICVLIGAVDNHACRLVCEEWFKSSSFAIYIDSANEYSSGEVVSCVKVKGNVFGKLRSEIFPEITKGDLRNVTELSCTELNEVAPQHYATNLMAGGIILSQITKLICENKPTAGIVYFDSMSMFMQPMLVGEDGL